MDHRPTGPQLSQGKLVCFWGPNVAVISLSVSGSPLLGKKGDSRRCNCHPKIGSVLVLEIPHGFLHSQTYQSMRTPLPGDYSLKNFLWGLLCFQVLEKHLGVGLDIVGLQLHVGEYNMNIVKFITHHVGIIITCSEIR